MIHYLDRPDPGTETECHCPCHDFDDDVFIPAEPSLPELLKNWFQIPRFPDTSHIRAL